jgi:hypothetical protein
MNNYLKMAFIISSGLFLIILNACTNTHYGFINNHRYRKIIQSTDSIPFAFYDKKREELNIASDSILKLIYKENSNSGINASSLNHLYSNFGEQLNIDRFYSQLLNKHLKIRKTLTPIQKEAYKKLTQSANWYFIHYYQNKQIRRILNRGEKGNNIPVNILRKSEYFLFSPFVRKLIKTDDNDSVIDKLPTTNRFKVICHHIFQKNDRLHTFSGNCFSLIGKIFFARHFEPNLQRIKNEKTANEILSIVKPYDIILEKSNTFVTNQVIPGYFTHVSVWLGVNNHRKRVLHSRRLNKEKKVDIHDRAMAEAITTGVRLSSLKEYTLGKIYLIIRYNVLNQVQKDSVFHTISKQLGKEYDFNFNIKSSDRINCTELLYLSFDFIPWITRTYLGRETLFPDDILQTALNNPDFSIVALVYNNGGVIQNPDKEFVENMIKE